MVREIYCAICNHVLGYSGYNVEHINCVPCHENRSNILGQIAQLKRFISETPPEEVISLMSLNARIDQLKTEGEELGLDFDE